LTIGQLYRDRTDCHAIEADALAATSKHLHAIKASLKASQASLPPTSIKRPLRAKTERR
jgi:hypothetical protein